VINPVPTKTRRYYLWVPREHQVDVHYLTEAFEGLAVPTTLDSRLGLMEIMVSPGGEEEIEEVLAALTQTYPGIKLVPARTAQTNRPGRGRN